MLDIYTLEKLRAEFQHVIDIAERNFSILMLSLVIVPIVLSLITVLFLPNYLPLLTILIPTICIVSPLILSKRTTIAYPENVKEKSIKSVRVPLFKIYEICTEKDRIKLKHAILNTLNNTFNTQDSLTNIVREIMSPTVSKSRKIKSIEKYRLLKVLELHYRRLLSKLVFTSCIASFSICILVPMILVVLSTGLGFKITNMLRMFYICAILPTCVGYIVGMRTIYKNIVKKIPIERSLEKLERNFEIICVLCLIASSVLCILF